MEKKDFLRLSLILNDNQSTTFKSKLKRLITEVLREHYGDGMTIQEIVIELRDNFTLEFSINEILSIIKGDEKTFVIKHKNSDQILNKYDLSIFAYTKASERSGGVSLTQIINDFLSTKTQDISVEQAEDLILRFLFIEFNEDTENLLNYMNKSISFPIPNENFSDEEKTFIDSFLSWDNKNKNKFIFNALSSSIDYCMITAQRDTRLIKDMFFNKTFYLDTNIIFRLAGINKQERQINAEAFIKKCKEANITIKYTNLVEEEIDNTVEYYVDSLAKTLGSHQHISPEAYALLSNNSVNDDFYKEYVLWVKDTANTAGNYSAFKSYLKKKIHKTLAKFEYEAIHTYNYRYKNFDELTCDFYEYKRKNHRNPSRQSIQTDINHYLFLKEKNGNKGHASFIDLNSYMITEDRSFVNWSKEYYPNTVPMVMLSSLWYSILLKFSSRTENDYVSFSQFIKFNLQIECKPFDKRRSDILYKILSLDESTEIKDEVIYDINSKLKTDYQDKDIDYIISTSHATITDRKIFEVNRQRDEQENKKEQQRHAENVENYNRGAQETIDFIVEKESYKQKRRNIALVSITLCLLVGSLIALIVLLTLEKPGLVRFSEWANKNGIIVSALFTILFTILQLVFKKIGVYMFNIDKIKERVQKKYQNTLHK